MSDSILTACINCQSSSEIFFCFTTIIDLSWHLILFSIVLYLVKKKKKYNSKWFSKKMIILHLFQLNILIMIALNIIGNQILMMFFDIMQNTFYLTMFFYFRFKIKKNTQGILGNNTSDNIMNTQCMIIGWVVFVMIYFGLGLFALLFSENEMYCKSIASLIFLLISCIINFFWIISGVQLIVNLNRSHYYSNQSMNIDEQLFNSKETEKEELQNLIVMYGVSQFLTVFQLLYFLFQNAQDGYSYDICFLLPYTALKDDQNLQIVDRFIYLLITFFTVDFPLIFVIKLFWVNDKNTIDQQDEENNKQFRGNLIGPGPINVLKEKNPFFSNSSLSDSSDQSGSERYTRIDFDPLQNIMINDKRSRSRQTSPEIERFSGSGNRSNSKNSAQMLSRTSSANGSINYGQNKIKKVFSSFSNDGIHQRENIEKQNEMKYQNINCDQSEIASLYDGDKQYHSKSNEKKQNNLKAYNYQPHQCSQILEDMKESQFTLQNQSDKSKNYIDEKQIDLSNMLNKQNTSENNGSQFEIQSNDCKESKQNKEKNKNQYQTSQMTPNKSILKNGNINKQQQKKKLNLQFQNQQDLNKKSTTSKKSDIKGQPSSYSECSGISFNL